MWALTSFNFQLLTSKGLPKPMLEGTFVHCILYEGIKEYPVCTKPLMAERYYVIWLDAPLPSEK
jgi:hypothetical protein